MGRGHELGLLALAKAERQAQTAQLIRERGGSRNLSNYLLASRNTTLETF